MPGRTPSDPATSRRLATWTFTLLVAGAAGGFVRGALRSRKNDPIFQRYVDRCLRDRGFDTIGWR